MYIDSLLESGTVVILLLVSLLSLLLVVSYLSSIYTLMMSTDYLGQDRIHAGDGSGLSIKHVGHSLFLSKHSSKTLSLHHLLHIPTITKSLICVSKFSHDNNVFFEFHAHSCFVQDQATNQTTSGETWN